MKRAALLWLALPGIVGCAGPETMQYRPTAVVRPLETRPTSRIFVGSFQDLSGGISTRDGMVPFRTQISPMLQEAVATELRRLGVTIVGGRDQADQVVSGVVRGASIEVIDDGQALVLQKASLSIEADLSDLSGRKLRVAQAEGHGGLRRFGSMSATQRIAMDAALADAVSQFRRLFEQGAAPAPVPAADLNRAAAEAQKAARRAELQAKLAAPLSPDGPRVEPEPVARRSELDALPPSVAPRAAHAVVIGVERYRERLPAADFAAADARLAAEYFKRALGVPAENVALLVDDRAAKSDFEKYLERWLPNRVHEGDEVYVYFSGHGAPNLKNGDAYLVPYDGDPTYIAETGYPLKKLYGALARLPAKRIVVAMDSCFSGAGGRSVIAKGARPLVTVQDTDVPGRITVLTAAAGDQISTSYEEKGHGLFTYFFLKALREKGSDMRAVYDSLKPQVARIARETYNADQDPQWRQGK